jgi:hypothetical protein
VSANVFDVWFVYHSPADGLSVPQWIVSANTARTGNNNSSGTGALSTASMPMQLSAMGPLSTAEKASEDHCQVQKGIDSPIVIFHQLNL